MKLKRHFVIIFLLCLILVGCNSGDKEKINHLNNDKNEETEIIFADEVFEKISRIAVGKKSGELTSEDFKGIKQLEIDMGWHTYELFISYHSYEKDKYVPLSAVGIDFDYEFYTPESVEDLKYFISMERLVLENASVKSLEFVKYMPNLKYLSLYDSPHDISPLASCRNLEYLEMNFSQVKEFSPLKQMDSLKTIYFNYDNKADREAVLSKIKEMISHVEIIYEN